MTTEPAEDFDFVADAEHNRAAQATEDKLAVVVALADEYERTDAAVTRLEEKLARGKAHREELLARRIPDAMSTAGLSEYTTTSGLKVVTKRVCAGSIPARTLETALSWLTANGHGDLIKTQIVGNFGRGQEHFALTLRLELDKMGVKVESKRTVHAQTLGAWGREMLDAGREFPAELLGLYVGQRAVISKEKNK